MEGHLKLSLYNEYCKSQGDYKVIKSLSQTLILEYLYFSTYGVNLRYFKLRFFHLTEFIVWNSNVYGGIGGFNDMRKS